MTTVGTSASSPHIPSNSPASPRRRRKGIVIACGVLLLLSVLFEFNPLHPIRWAHDFQRNCIAGWRAASVQIAQDSLKALRTTQAWVHAQTLRLTPAASVTTP
ncbi:MAG TPA: hypothetical protein VNU46_04395 [Gemmatimonadaceae bacterium]|jgi:hypothetical protein|nr:hypothetical protein [Gemmatimonadaceae bacterium]